MPESRTGGSPYSNTYNSPIDFACQKNYIVLLSDGEPTQDTGAENRIESLPGFGEAVGPRCERLPGEWSNDGKCLDEMAEYMYKHDLSNEFFGDQNVTTYTIGFAIDLPLLEATAEKSGGKYFLADNTTTLASALTKIVVSILDDASTFTAPSVPVNAFNRTQNLDDVFVSVFNPSSTVHWPGNVKKYKLINGVFVDVNDNPAVDPATGFFKEDAQSYWSSEADGDRPPAGGAAEQLPDHADRELYTNVAGGDLNATGNQVRVTNSTITGAMLGGADDSNADATGMTERDYIVEWMRGLDVNDANDNGETDDTRRQMGDPLHVRPVPVIYGGTADNPDMVIYTSTNDGYMHAIDPDDGSELWAFVPERLLPLMKAQYLDETSPLRVYGLDGDISVTVLNDDEIGGITGSERVILTFGMRRGGDAVFALDVTDRNDPQLLWEIDSSTPGFEALGQTWSTPQYARVKLGGDYEDVVFFAGGYDPGQDNETWRTDSQGNAVYMVDIETGELLWSAGPDSSHDLVLAEMQHSIPAPLRVIDLNSDGLASRIYFGDMGGRVWKIDLMNGFPVDEFGRGGVMASLGGAGVDTPTTADLRRFYNQADVVNTVYDGKRFLAVNIGSGYRAHPLDREIDEWFFSVRDFYPTTALASTAYTTPVPFDALVDITDGGGIDVGSTQPGWRLELKASGGEKVLGRSVTFDGVIYFTSFAPGSAANACTAVAGQNRLYAISLFNGFTVLPDDEPYITLKQGGIGAQVELYAVSTDEDGDGEDDTTKLRPCIGVECVDPDIDADLVKRSYWSQDGAE